MENNRWRIEVNKWLNSLSIEMVDKVWKVVQTIKSEQELRNQTKIQVPIEKLERAGVLPDDRKAIISALNNLGAILVYKTESDSSAYLYRFDEKMLDDPKTEIFLAPFEAYGGDTKIFDYLFSKLRKKHSSGKPVDRLSFYSEDNKAAYKNAVGTFPKGKKAFVLLSFLNEEKNTPYSVANIKSNCNPNITIERHCFKGYKDIYDTVSYIRKQLKVNRNEFFPIRNQKNNWIWLEK